MNPDELRATPDALEFTKHFFQEGKPVAAICHAPWGLTDAGEVRGRKLTSCEHIQTDVKNAGGNWVNQDVVVDNGLVASRKPDDIPAFNKKMIEEFGEGKHARQTQFAGQELEARFQLVRHPERSEAKSKDRAGVKDLATGMLPAFA